MQNLYAAGVVLTVGVCAAQLYNSSILVVCPPPVISNGYVVPEQEDMSMYRPGYFVTVNCEEGYKLMNTDKMMCTQDGKWSIGSYQLDTLNQELLPLCIENTCVGPLAPLSSGSIEVMGDRGWDGGYMSGTTVNYRCNKGFVLEPSSSWHRVCQRGKWTGSEVTCVPTGCPQPQKILNGYHVFNNPGDGLRLGSDPIFEIGRKVVYFCEEGHELEGTAVYECTSSGFWSPAVPPLCVRRKDSTGLCPALRNVPHAQYTVTEGHLRPDGAVYGTVVEYSCKKGYRDRHTPCYRERVHCHSGKWVGRHPKCVAFDGCEKPQSILNGMFYGEAPTYPVHTEVVYSCRQGYRLHGKAILTCQQDGCWSPASHPICMLQEEIFHVSGGQEEHEELFPSFTLLMSLGIGCGVMVVLFVVCMVVVCRHRKGAQLAAGPWPVTVSPESPVDNRPPSAPNDPDRVALIAFADGVQVVLPSYEEAIRERAPPAYDFHGVHRSGSRHHRPALPPLRRPRSGARDRDNSDTLSHHSFHVGPTRQSSSSTSHSASLRSTSVGDSMGSTDTMTPSEVSTTVTVDTMSSNASNASQTPSCRAMCGSLASFDTSSVLNTEGVPLLEENELEVSSEAACSDPGDNRSMRSEASSK